MAKQGCEKPKPTKIVVPKPYAVIELGPDPVDVHFQFTLQAAGNNGSLRVFAHLAPPKQKRQKKQPPSGAAS